MTGLAQVEKLERLLLHVWPSVEAIHEGPWVLRFAHGYSGRANSASALAAGATIDLGLLARAETYFTGHGLPSTFRLTPLVCAGAASALDGNGYARKDDAVTMTASLRPHTGTDAISVSHKASAHWLSGVTSLNEDRSKQDPAHLAAITSRMKPPVAFATIDHEGVATGYAICAIRDGWAELGSIIIAPQARGRGLGRSLVEGLLHWAVENGAAQAFLQVDVKNFAAIALYRSLGFSDCYGYSTWRKL